MIIKYLRVWPLRFSPYDIQQVSQVSNARARVKSARTIFVERSCTSTPHVSKYSLDLNGLSSLRKGEQSLNTAQWVIKWLMIKISFEQITNFTLVMKY